MRIAAGTLFFALAVFLNSIELISSIRMTLKDLFPGNNDIEFPAIKNLGYQVTQRYRNFRTLDYRQMSDPTGITFLARDYVIIGWKDGNYIKPLSLLFGGYHAFVVFDRKNDQWVTLGKNEFEQLGLNRMLPLVRAIDRVAAEVRNEHQAQQHAHTEGSEQIHIAASQEAYVAAENQEKIQMALLQKGRGVYAGCAYMIQKAYRRAYNTAYLHYSYLTKF